MDHQHWTKSTFSQTSNCVEWAVEADGSHVVVRQSTNPEGAKVRFTRSEWLAFLKAVKAGEADLETPSTAPRA